MKPETRDLIIEFNLMGQMVSGTAARAREVAKYLNDLSNQLQTICDYFDKRVKDLLNESAAEKTE